jgi:hypothetical protein
VHGTVGGAGCAGGTVRLKLTHGGIRVASTTLTLGADCSFTRRLSARGRVKVSVQFLGTATLAPISVSRTRRV